ncbi:hypothetical protein Tco_0273574 [Tanacetum coccineum]
MKIDLDDKTDVLTYHKKLLAEAQKEKEDLKAKVEKWHNSSKNLIKLLNTQMSANDKFRLGYGDHKYDGILSYENEVLQSVFMNKKSEIENQPLYDRFVTAKGMHDVPPPMTGNYMPSGPDVEVDDSKFTYGPKQTQPNESESQTSEFDTCESNISAEPSELVSELVVSESNVKSQPKVWSDAPIIEEYESDSEDEVDYPHRALKNKGIVDSGCSRHMMGTRLPDEFQIFISGHVVLRTSEFHYLFVSQYVDKKNKDSVTDSECLLNLFKPISIAQFRTHSHSKLPSHLQALISTFTMLSISSTMAVLDSCLKHNMVAYLDKSEGNEEFHDIIDFLKQFYSFCSYLAGKSVSISEASIQSDLCFDDADGIDTLPNQAIFNAIQQMGKVPIEHQPNPSLRPSPTTTIPASIPETSGDNLGDQAKEIQALKTQITKLKKQAKPVIKHHKAYLKSVSLKQRFPRKSFSQKHRVHKEYVSKQGRKFEKGEFPSVQLRSTDIDERMLSTEDVLSTDKEGVSTDFEKFSTDRPIVSTDGSKVSTDRQIEGTEDQVEGAEDHVKGTDEHNEGTEDKNEGTEEIFEGIEELREGYAREEKCKKSGKLKRREIELLKKKLANEELIRDFDDMKARLRQIDSCEKLQEQESEQFTIEERAKFLQDQLLLSKKKILRSKKDQKPLGIKTTNKNQLERSDEDFISIGLPEDEKFDQRMNEKGVVMDKYQDEMPEGFDRVLWGDLMVLFNSDDKDEFWSSQLDWIISLKKRILCIGVDKICQEDTCRVRTELESEEHKNWLVHKQTACGKDFSNPFMVDNLPKIVRFSTHLASVVKSWLVHDQTVHALASPKANELAIPEQTATGKGTSNPLMAGSLPKTTKPT